MSELRAEIERLRAALAKAADEIERLRAALRTAREAARRALARDNTTGIL